MTAKLPLPVTEGGDQRPSVLILGARGRLGLSAAQAFAAAGWRVLGQVRVGAAQPSVAGVTWLAQDVQDPAALAQHAAGAQVVVHALNPAYTNAAWQAQVLPLTEAALQVAQHLGATLMVPGNVYNFGPDAPVLLRTDTAQHAHTAKGRVRVAMEQCLRDSPVQTVVIRAGDFFGQGRGSWFDQVVAKELPRGVLRYPAAPGVQTAWAYLPDLAQTLVRVAHRRQQLGAHTVLHFAGHSLSAQDWARVLAQPAQEAGWVAAGQLPAVRSMPWWLLRAAGVFHPLLASMAEMRYLWQRPYALDNYELVALLGEEPRTPLAQAARQALAQLYPALSATHAGAVTVAG